MQIHNGWLVTVKHATRYFRLIFQITHKASPKWPYVPIPKAKQYDTIQYKTASIQRETPGFHKAFT